MEEKYIIGIDLDGTLLNSKSKLSHSTISYLKKISKQGHIIVLCTGRPLRAMLPFYQQLKLKTPVICYNGGRVFNPNDNFFPSITYSFNKEDIKDIINSIGLEKIDNIMCEVDDKAWVYAHDKKIEEILWHNNISLIYGDLNKTLNENPITFLIFSKHKECKKLISKNIKEKYPTLKYRFWNGYLENFSEIFDKHISKYNALKSVAKYYKIPLENIITFGDGENDIDMISKANYGYAMVNAPEDIKSKAKYITTKDNDHDGVIIELKKIIKNK
ncbi:MAG: Cof-type HAD-IIB family hydrolase [Bacilli bacterium]